MNPQVLKVETLPSYKLKLQFDDGEKKVFDVKPYLDKGLFRELKNEEYFKKVRVAFGSVQWPNSQDFSKDTLYLLGISEFQ